MKLIAATDAGRALATRCCEDREWLKQRLDALDPEERERVRDTLALLTRA